MIASVAYAVLDLLLDRARTTNELLIDVPATLSRSVSSDDVLAAISRLSEKAWIKQRAGQWQVGTQCPSQRPGEVPSVEEIATLLGLPEEHFPKGIAYERSYPEDPWFRHARDLEAALENEGYQARLTSAAMPLQIKGTLPTGTPFYFRWQGGLAELQVTIPEWLATGSEYKWSGHLREQDDDAWNISVVERAFRTLVGKYQEKYRDELPRQHDGVAP